MKIQPLSIPTESSDGSQLSLRHSSCTGKGNRGQLDQLRNIKQVQTATHTRPATQSLDIAMQGQPVNPMAPSYHFNEETESQIPLWTAFSAGSTLTPQSQGVPDEAQVRPSFTLSQPGDQFGVKLSSSSVSGNFGSATQPTKVSSALQAQVR